MTRSEKALSLTGSRHFVSWLSEQRVSLVFSTYQAGKLFLVGLSKDGRLSVFERTFARCMGIGLDPLGETLWVATLYQLLRFENALKPGQDYGGYDRVFVPQVAYTTGDIDVHDVAVGKGGPIFASTLFSCLARPSERYSFEPVWHPPFITRLAAEDRCHLNGLAMMNDEPAFVTCVSRTDANEGWRENRTEGGIVIDVCNNAILCEGLSMPHSPRWYRDRLWLLNSGTGEFGYFESTSGEFVPVAFCPGYLRGLSFHGDYAVVGLSKPRPNQSFEGLQLHETLARKNVSARCGLQVINLVSGDIEHELRIDGVVQELYDTCVLQGVERPMAVGFLKDDIRTTLSIPPGTEFG